MNKRGISMISLVIIIIVTTILIGIAISAGYRYIEEGNNLKAQALGVTIGYNAGRRQNDLTSGTADRYYEGYYLDIDKIKGEYVDGKLIKDYFEGVPSEAFDDEDSLWYLIDAESATNLGSDGTENLLTRNISYDLTNESSIEVLKVVLVDYTYGNGYYITIPANVARLALKNDPATDGCPLSPDGKHRYTIATCTEGSTCIYGCGVPGPNNGKPLGHKWVSATCTAAGYCERCNAVNPDDDQPLGHLYINNSQVNDPELTARMAAKECFLFVDALSEEAWVADAEKHWHECIRCGVKKLGDREPRDNNAADSYIGTGVHYFEDENGYLYIFDDTNYHHQKCRICGWESIKSRHEYERKPVFSNGQGLTPDRDFKNEPTTHEIYCKLCNFPSNVRTHDLSEWQPDHPDFHYKYCVSCTNNLHDPANCNQLVITVNTVEKHVYIKEDHFDNDGNGMCDVCVRNVDTIPPLDFNIESGSDVTFARVKVVNDINQITTSRVTVEAYTIDRESGLAYYQFGIKRPGDANISWYNREEDKVVPTSSSFVANFEFKELKNNTHYDFYVRAYDKNNNSNTVCRVSATTADFPAFKGLKDIPDPYVNGSPGPEIGVNAITTDMPNGMQSIKLQYRQNGSDGMATTPSGGEWSAPVPLAELSDMKIHLTKEKEVIEFMFVDDANNTSDIILIDPPITVIDNTPVEVTIAVKDGENNTSTEMLHYATVTLADRRAINGVPGNGFGAGIKPGTLITYGWNDSNTARPTTTYTYRTENYDIASRYSFDINTPPGANGRYYLWIYEGILDAVGNETTEPTVSSMSFDVDDEKPELTNIKMFNADPAVPGEELYVKTGGTVTVTFTASKELRANPIVRINNINASTITHNTRNEYTCTFPIDTNYEEGLLDLFIGDVTSKAGRLSERSYNEEDLIKGPVRYDRTLPVIVYIPKNER